MLRIALSIFLLFTLTAPSSIAKSPPSTSPPGVALVLAGGGARGLAHVGFLKALEENNIRISAIAGTSMGALMAGLYACGYSAEQLDSLTSGMNWTQLFSSAPEPGMTLLPDRIRGRQDLIKLGLRGLTPTLPASAVSNMRIGFLLSGMTGPAQVLKGFNFDSLSIPLRVVSSDLLSRDRIVFSQGELYKYQLASMAIPGIFPPFIHDSLILVDGGVFDNMPVDVAEKAWPDLPVLAVNVGMANPTEFPDAPSLLTVFGMTINALSIRVNDYYYREPQWLFTPDLHNSAVWSFDLTDSLIAWGYNQGMAWIAENPDLPTGAQRREGWHPPDFTIRNILYRGNDNVSMRAIDRWLPLTRGNTLNTWIAMDAAEKLYASGLFSMIRMSMLPADDPSQCDLAFTVTEKDPGTLGFGLSYNNDFGLDARFTIEHKNSFNRGIKTIINTGGGSNYAFLELSSFTNTSHTNRYFSLSGSLYQIKGNEPDGSGSNPLRIWTDHSVSITMGRPFSWYGIVEFATEWKGRSYVNGNGTEAFPLLTATYMTDTRADPTTFSQGTRVFLKAGWCAQNEHSHASVNWDITSIHNLRFAFLSGASMWGSLLWGDNYQWEESRLTAPRGIPGHRWNSLPSRERVAGSIFASREVLGPMFLEVKGAATYDFDSIDQYKDGEIHWGAGLSCGVNIPGGTARLGPGWNENGNTRWTFSYGSDYSFGPGR
ncbi:MAG: patatin-like phospholipase family protein [Candidatus Sabulitectum sp.]|nr:patatin-like phospholipase family protein [Candidatus Sabulitectum sp.]